MESSFDSRAGFADKTPKRREAVWGMFRCRERWGLSFKGWAILLLAILAVAAGFVSVIHPFLSVESRVEGEFLVIEGWVPDYAMQQGIGEFEAHPYKKIITTGEPLAKGFFLSEHKTFAEVGAATLRKLGMTSNQVVAVPSKYTRRGRTYASAVALRTWFEEQRIEPRAINIITSGPHSRRSRLIYGRVLGPTVRVGVIPVESAEYDPRRWWQYSAGLRAMIGETAAYLNACLFGK
jgi:hypothetical protein